MSNQRLLRSSQNQKIIRLLLCLAFFSIVSVSLFAQTYYIDFQGGNDGNSGTTTSAAWRTIPGTRNAANTAYLTTSYGGGTISAINKVPAGTVFMLKPGTIMSSANGGMVWITSAYYATSATVANPISFQAYQNWPGSSGSVTFDGTGITLGGTNGWGLIHITVGGIAFDGKVPKGITVQNSAWCGISCYTSSQVAGYTFNDLYLYNNGTGYTAQGVEGAADGQIKVLWSSGGSCTNSEFNGNNQLINGIAFADSNMAVTGYTVSNCLFYGHRGLAPDDDAGIGVKAQNSQITVKNCVMHDNDKGLDMGEVSGNGANILYKIIDCTSYHNTNGGAGYGFACSGPGYTPYAGTVNFYFINDIAYNNLSNGFVSYAGPFNAYFIHCVSDGNVTGGQGGNYIFWPDTNTDGKISIHIYNSIGYKPQAGASYPCNMMIYQYFKAAGDPFTVDSDYNCWRAKASENFAVWDLANKSGGVQFSYSQGPGSTTSNWYSLYDYNSTTPPAGGMGHYHSDAHSMTFEPPFTNQSAHDYTLMSHLPGANLSSETWYIPEMGIDANGVTRTSWDIGAYESTGGLANLSAPTGLRIK
jgi:hypothetical protein